MTFSHIPRRDFIKVALATSVLPIALTGCNDGESVSPSISETSTSSLRLPKQIAPLFLNESEVETLTQLVDQLIPPDQSPGGGAAGCAEAIQYLLSAFSFDPPMIFAGGPFSNRGGAESNDFEKFISLDRYETLAWQLRIEGSQDRPERLFNGPVKGWQQIYREGLTEVGRLGPIRSLLITSTPGPLKPVINGVLGNSAITDLIAVAFPHALEFMYGAPEYGGNRDLVGWGFTQYDGDVQPKGYSNEQVINPDNPSLIEQLGLFRGENQGRDARIASAQLLPVPELNHASLLVEALTQLTALRSDESSLAMMIEGQSDLNNIKRFVQNKRPMNNLVSFFAGRI